MIQIFKQNKNKCRKAERNKRKKDKRTEAQIDSYYLVDIERVIVVKKNDVRDDGLLLQAGKLAERLKPGYHPEILVDITT